MPKTITPILIAFCLLLTASCAPTPKPQAASDTAVAPPPVMPQVKLQTNRGDIIIELNNSAAPLTVANFIQYVEADFYNGTIFHRVIYGFMIQGGGFTPRLQKKQPRAPIASEGNNGLLNLRGTISMARTNDPDSATCQFFINHKDNPPLNYLNPARPGYTVFGRVIAGMEVVDAIATQPVAPRGPHQNVPVDNVIIQYAELITN